ncbi:hypothetical protein BRADI_1g64115v3 [Brachypodium distachyon]|uniref:Uncharacterized protein n=1 Tax=Brachypodium distachyon TaxID=15368 RepID=A0A2K2DTB6_BRADI|nr:hypothetical protein BRADI_1g64115v3 [Brachypodium distachyon]
MRSCARPSSTSSYLVYHHRACYKISSYDTTTSSKLAKSYRTCAAPQLAGEVRRVRGSASSLAPGLSFGAACARVLDLTSFVRRLEDAWGQEAQCSFPRHASARGQRVQQPRVHARTLCRRVQEYVSGSYPLYRAE